METQHHGETEQKHPTTITRKQTRNHHDNMNALLNPTNPFQLDQEQLEGRDQSSPLSTFVASMSFKIPRCIVNS